MGASGWGYVTPYRGSLEATLEALHDEAFEELYGDGDEYGSREELYADEEFMGEEGTHSILDVQRLVETTEPPQQRETDYFTLRPLPTAHCPTCTPLRHGAPDRAAVRRRDGSGV